MSRLLASSLVLTLQACSPEPYRRPFVYDDADRFARPSHAQISPDGRLVSARIGDSLWIFATDGSTSFPVEGGLEGQFGFATPFMSWSPDSRRLLFRAGEGGPTRPPIGTAQIVDFGQATLESRTLLPDSLTERLITTPNYLVGGPEWSPDGRQIAFVARDIRRSGRPSLAYVVRLADGSVTAYVEKDLDLFDVAWSPDGRWLAFGAGTFRGNRGVVGLLDVEGGLAPMTHRVSIGSDLHRNLEWSPDGRWLITADRGGSGTLFELGEDELLSPVKSSDPRGRQSLELASFVGWLPDSRHVLAIRGDGMARKLWMVDARSGLARALTSDDGVLRSASLARGGERAPVLAFSWESGASPPEIYTSVVDVEAGELRLRHAVTSLGQFRDSVLLPDAEIVTWSAANGESLEAQVFWPPAEGTGLPPSIVIAYGAFANEFPRMEYFVDRGIPWLTSNGYAVVRPNTRGIASQPQRTGYGAVQLEDTHRLIDTLAATGRVDGTRVAVIGHSHGGTMAYYYATHSERFCAMVAVNGAADWAAQAEQRTMTGLPAGLGGGPHELPDVYREASPLANARAVTVPTLVVAGARDGQVLPENATRFADSLQAAGIAHELLFFEDEGHVLTRPSNVRRFWNRTLSTLEAGC